MSEPRGLQLFAVERAARPDARTWRRRVSRWLALSLLAVCTATVAGLGLWLPFLPWELRTLAVICAVGLAALFVLEVLD